MKELMVPEELQCLIREGGFQEAVEVVTKGRHDPCVGIRAVPIGEAMVAIVLADHYLRHRGQTGQDTAQDIDVNLDWLPYDSSS